MVEEHEPGEVGLGVIEHPDGPDDARPRVVVGEHLVPGADEHRRRRVEPVDERPQGGGHLVGGAAGGGAEIRGRRARRQLGQVIFGQEQTVEQALISILSGGHVLLIGINRCSLPTFSCIASRIAVVIGS